MVAMSQRRRQCSWYGRLFCIIYQHFTGNVRKITVAECTTLSLYTHLFVLYNIKVGCKEETDVASEDQVPRWRWFDGSRPFVL